MKKSAKIISVLLSVMLLAGVLVTAVLASAPTLNLTDNDKGVRTSYYTDFTGYAGGFDGASTDGATRYLVNGTGAVGRGYLNDKKIGTSVVARGWNWTGEKDLGKTVNFNAATMATYSDSNEVNTYLNFTHTADMTYVANSEAPTLDFFIAGGNLGVDGDAQSKEYVLSHDYITVDFDICADKYVDANGNFYDEPGEGRTASWYGSHAFFIQFRSNSGNPNLQGREYVIWKDAKGYYLAPATDSGNTKYYLPTEANVWTHLTFVIEVDHSSDYGTAAGASVKLGNFVNSKIHVYINGNYWYTDSTCVNTAHSATAVTSAVDAWGNIVTNTTAMMLLKFGKGTNLSGTNFSEGFDNYTVNYYTRGYEGDLADFALGTAGSKIYECDDVVFNNDYKFASGNKPVATVTDANDNIEEFFFMDKVLEHITEGSTLTLYQDSTETYFVDFPFTVVTNGHSFAYTSNDYEAVEIEGGIAFQKSTNKATVYWDDYYPEVDFSEEFANSNPFVVDGAYVGPFKMAPESFAKGNQIVYTGPTVVPAEGQPGKVYVLDGWTDTISPDGTFGEIKELPIAEGGSEYQLVAVYHVEDVCYSVNVGGVVTNYLDFDNYADNILALENGAVVTLYAQPEAVVDGLNKLITVNVAEGVSFKFSSKTVTATNVDNTYAFAEANTADMVTINWLDSDNKTVVGSQQFAKGSIAIYKGDTSAFTTVVTNNGFYNLAFTSIAPVELLDPAVTYEGAPIMNTPVEALEVLITLEFQYTAVPRWLVRVPDESLGVTDLKIANANYAGYSVVNIYEGRPGYEPLYYYNYINESPGIANDINKVYTKAITYKVNGVEFSKNVQTSQYMYLEKAIGANGITDTEKTVLADAANYYYSTIMQSIHKETFETSTVWQVDYNRTAINNILTNYASSLSDSSYATLYANFTEAELDVSMDGLLNNSEISWMTSIGFELDTWYDSKYPTATSSGYRPIFTIKYDVDALAQAAAAEGFTNKITQNYAQAGLIMQDLHYDLATNTNKTNTMNLRFLEKTNGRGDPSGVWFAYSSMRIYNFRQVIKFALGISQGDGYSAETTRKYEGTYSLAKCIVDGEAAGQDTSMERALYVFSASVEAFKKS